MSIASFDYTYIDNHINRTIFLLHGTGGTKNDFLFLDDLLKLKYNLVGIEGNIREQGMSRYFKRFSEGVFDQESIKEESEKLFHFIENWKKKNTPDHSYSYLGYSNGANILLATLFYYPAALNNLVLLHPMLPFEPASLDLSNHTLLITQGNNDPLISQAQQTNIINLLESFHCNPVLKIYNDGHHLTNKELEDVVTFLSRVRYT